jgi:hypothetical protein
VEAPVAALMLVSGNKAVLDTVQATCIQMCANTAQILQR